ncbi:hypothetical protein SAMN05421644_1532 [Allochromatium warmingii]|uniref:Sel1 repeat-containing protein n=1 Tax=Allochromatium warmingii TaxID=61595 RepID=A0A1H3J7E2_ALLWA|nr:tetratricopeptide repeat protein [Allochromatium warmingii]SDY35515.1 hypothetical protein SAMN05421644_1532 [Allochromatium warmingii]
MAQDIRLHPVRLLVYSALLAGLVGCATTTEPDDPTLGLPPLAPIVPGRGIDDLVLVDCLLPGQIRQLGTRMTYLTPRRLVKSTKSECGIRGGEFVLFDRSDYATALQTLLPKAQNGDAISQNYVGEIYEKGLGLPAPDYIKAAEWYRKAAEQNHSPAQTNLGSLYERGLGVNQDKAQALNWYRKASGLTEDTLIFESALKAQAALFQREIAVRNQVAAALRQQLRTASAQASGMRRELERQVKSQRLDATSQAEQRRKELHAVQVIKEHDLGGSKTAQQGKLALVRNEQQYRAQLGKLELTRTAQYQALVDTSRELAQK